MIRTLRRQEGSALVTAMLVMMLCLMVGFTAMSTVDVQQSQSRGERERESSFALGEGALNAQIFMLSTQWPATRGGRAPPLHAGDGRLDAEVPGPDHARQGLQPAPTTTRGTSGRPRSTTTWRRAPAPPRTSSTTTPTVRTRPGL